MTTNAMQFDGTLGSAVAVAEWADAPTKINAGPGHLIAEGVEDTVPGGLDLITEDADGVRYVTVKAGDYVVRAGDDLVAFSAQQYGIAFPDA